VAEEHAFAAFVPAAGEPRISHEHCEHAWFTPDQAAALVPFAGLRRAVKLAVALTVHQALP
jgi:hypothetical protein